MVEPKDFRKRVLLKALKLELQGLTRRGRSAYVIIKDDFGLRGSRQSVYDQLQQQIEEGDYVGYLNTTDPGNG